MALELVAWPLSYIPTATEWRAALNFMRYWANAGIDPSFLAKTPGGRVAINVLDAATLDGATKDMIVGGDFPEVKKTMSDFFVPGTGLVLQGGAPTINGGIANQLDIEAIIALVKDSATGYLSRIELAATHVTTLLANETYFLDLAPGAVAYSWGTAHPVGDYTPIATVTTNGDANIATVTDTRVLSATLLEGMDASILFPLSWMGSGTLNDALVPANDAGTVLELLGEIGYMLKLISGKTSWRTAPARSLENAVGTARAINTTSPITGGGTLAGDLTLAHATTAGNKHVPTGGAAGNVLEYSADGTAAWTARLTTAETGVTGKVGKGTDNANIEQVFSMLLPVDTRSLIATAWDADNNATTLEIRNGANVLVTITKTYTGGKLTSMVAAGNGKTITWTIAWNGDKLESVTKAVA